MFISQKLAAAINDQIAMELQSYYSYYAMSLHFAGTPFAGFASFFLKQAGEEQEHAAKFCEYLHDRDATVHLKALNAPTAEFSSLLEACRLGLKQEMRVTESIHNLVSVARAEQDYATEQFLDWFVAEQVEEQALFQHWIDQLEMVGDNPTALLRLDAKAAQRDD